MISWEYWMFLPNYKTNTRVKKKNKGIRTSKCRYLRVILNTQTTSAPCMNAEFEAVRQEKKKCVFGDPKIDLRKDKKKKK